MNVLLAGTAVRRSALLSAVAAGLLLVSSPTIAAAQVRDEPEPVLDQLRETFSQPGLTLGMLLQTVIDPGLDDATTASAQVAAARLRLFGELDGGFHYMFQTNFAASPSLLDARVGWTHSDALTVYAGRFKTPFSRELLTFAGSIDFVNRSRVVSALAPNRQVGVQVGGSLDERVGWSAGGFTGANNTTANESLAGVFRLEGRGIAIGDGTLAAAGHVGVGRDGAIGTRALGGAFVGDGVLLGADARYEAGQLLLAAEVIRADWDPVGPVDVDADGLYLTAGWMVRENHQGLVRWDRYRAPGTVLDDDVVVLGYNTWPTTATEIQVNWILPLRDSGEPYRLLVNLQMGF